MPAIYQQPEQHTEEMQDIITAPPAWLLQWGITLFFAVLLLMLGMSAMIRYPDIVKTQLKINSANAPKPVMAKRSGKMIKLLVHEGQDITDGQPLAYLESTAKHEQVLNLLKTLKNLQEQLYKDNPTSFELFNTPRDLQLGEVQGSYQSFFQSYLTYKASVSGGFYLKKRMYLQKDLEAIKKQKNQLVSQKQLQEKEYALANQEYTVHQKLAEQRVIAQMELKREESKLLTKKLPLQQTESAFITNSTLYSAKEKEVLELDNQIQEEKSKFIQALNSLLSEMENWKSNYVLSASQAGKLAFSGIIQQNQFIDTGQEIFYINPENTDFFGEMNIPQYNMGKVMVGQKVLIKLRSFPYEEYGMIRGSIAYIADVPYHDSIFVSKVSLNDGAFSELKRSLNLKNGMTADAEIITQDATLLNRLFRSFSKMIDINK
ncbi:MAG TPA: HlyD family efflux transporter periplasmic adaptor subunit [Sphingobacteriaceae bacterium]|nr:HlyD family efflux transporter periplasmic adaptor subunit [Sphingobacteriaceae bacterium]